MTTTNIDQYMRLTQEIIDQRDADKLPSSVFLSEEEIRELDEKEDRILDELDDLWYAMNTDEHNEVERRLGDYYRRTQFTNSDNTGDD